MNSTANSPDPASDSVAATTDSGDAPAAPAAWRRGRAIPLWTGIAAVVLALIGQHFLAPAEGPPQIADVLIATAWYVLAVAVLVLGWWESYTNGRLEHIPRAAETTIPVRRAGRLGRAEVGRLLRFGGAMVALSANLWALRLLRPDWTSWAGLLLWIASLAGLVLAVLGERPTPVPRKPAGDQRGDATAWHLPPAAEAALFLGILALALALRVWRLGDLAPGLHGDEGEAGAAALGILRGDLVSPFTPGWFNQSNFYYWAIALGMKLFGTGLGGLRAFAVLCGLVTVAGVYGCAREMFGQRAAILAGTFAAVGSASVLLSRLEFSNATLPAFFAVTFYWLVRGLRTRRHVYFLGAGLAAGFAGYFFAGGWLVPIAAGAALVYLALFRPGFLAAYGSRVGAFLLALVMIGAPFWIYFADHPLAANQYPNGLFIWGHYDLLAAQYNDDNWATVLGDHLTRTLSILTYRSDASALGILDYPPALPLESALIVLGLAWAVWRWRDTRFALLSIWFWIAALGGLLTTDAPNLPRLAGILPVLAILMASVLDHLAAQVPRVVSDFGRLPHLEPVGRGLGALVVVGVLGIAGVQHAQLFLGHYLTIQSSPDVTTQAAVVQQKGTRYRYYDLGGEQIFWAHGDNRFLNPDASGGDLPNMAGGLPLTDNGPNADQDAIFLVWGAMSDYLPVLQAYYPEGSSETIPLDTSRFAYEPLTTYTVTHAQIDAHRVLLARYAPAGGTPVERSESQAGLAGGATPPADLTYPAGATWDGGLIAPAYRPYRFRLTAPAGTRLTIDGVDVLTGTVAGRPADAEVTLARGLHAIRLAALLPDASARVDLLWSETGDTLKHVDRRYLWDNHVGAGWLGEIHPVDPQDPLSGDDTALQHGQRSQDVLGARLDAFLGFRDAGQAFGAEPPLGATWAAALAITATGVYTFDLHTNGPSILSVDGQEVVANTAGGAQDQRTVGSIELDAGPHTIGVRYAWLGGTGALECGWTPPDGDRTLLLSPALRPPAPGVWPP